MREYTAEELAMMQKLGLVPKDFEPPEKSPTKRIEELEAENANLNAMLNALVNGETE